MEDWKENILRLEIDQTLSKTEEKECDKSIVERLCRHPKRIKMTGHLDIVNTHKRGGRHEREETRQGDVENFRMNPLQENLRKAPADKTENEFLANRCENKDKKKDLPAFRPRTIDEDMINCLERLLSRERITQETGNLLSQKRKYGQRQKDDWPYFE